MIVASALAQMGVACWDYDLAQGDLWWSENAGPLFGRPPGYQPSSFEEAMELFVPDGDRPAGIESMVKVLESGPMEAERQTRLVDGSIRWTGHRYFLMVDQSGNPVRLAGMMMDIDERKRRELENEVLFHAGQVLSESLDVEQISRAVARLLVPNLADWCIVDLVQDGQLTPITIAHADPDKVAWAEAIRTEYPPDVDAPDGAGRVVRTGELEIYPDITDDMLQAGARDDRHLDILRSVGFRSVMLVPLRTRSEVIGTATLVMAESQRRFDQGSIDFARRLATQMAASIDNARLHGQLTQALQNERIALETLQRGFTPGPLPDLEGIALADHYEIGGSDKVGGDWYDVFETEQSGAVAFVIGDVSGRGVTAVATMSRYRNALRALLMEGHSPGDALQLLHRFAVADRRGDGFATIACFTYETETRQLTWSVAGHLPAMIRYADGRVESLWERPAPPLGVGAGDYSQEVLTLAPECLLVLYTDGLIERRGESLDLSIDRLSSEVASSPGEPKDLVAHLLANLSSHPSTDDVAILAVRFENSEHRDGHHQTGMSEEET